MEERERKEEVAAFIERKPRCYPNCKLATAR